MSETHIPTGRTLAPRRHDEILKRLAADGSVSIADLAAFFDVSRETIRRDIKVLADKGQLDIIHGGAARFQAIEPDLIRRTQENARGKTIIGRLAADFVEDGMVVFLDSGTTTLAVAHAIGAARQNLTICTASLAVALYMCHLPNVRVHVIGGEIDPNEEAAVGIDMIEAIARFRIDIAFLGGGALSPDGEVTDFTRAGAEQRSRMLATADRAYFVLDGSKFGQLTPLRIPRFELATAVIVDYAPPIAIRDALLRKGPKLITP